MQGLENLKVYVVNLDRSPERLKSIDKRLKDIGLDYTRISAVDGKVREFTSKEINKNKYSFFHGKYITPTEVACFVSHVNVWEEFEKNNDAEFALVLEDDMIFSDEFVSVLKALVKDKKSWDVVKLNGGHKGGNLKVKNLTNKTSLVLNLFHQSKTGAYIMNKKAAKSYLSKIYPMFVPIDHEFIKFWKYGLNIFSVYPFPSVEEDVPSTIDYNMVKKNRKPRYKKLPVMFYKSYIAILRLILVSFKFIKNKFTFLKK